jgi:hypothetical protein
MQTSNLPVEDVAIGSVLAAKDDEDRLVFLSGDASGLLVVG